MATEAKAAKRGQEIKESTYAWTGKNKAGKIVRGEMRASGEAVVKRHPAQARHPGHVGQKTDVQARRNCHRKRRRTLHTPIGDDDEIRRPFAPDLRHRRAWPRQPTAVSKLLLDIKTDVETGSSLSQAFQKFPPAL